MKKDLVGQSDTKEVDLNQTPFFQAIFTWQTEPTTQQLFDWWLYYRHRNEVIWKEIKQMLSHIIKNDQSFRNIEALALEMERFSDQLKGNIGLDLKSQILFIKDLFTIAKTKVSDFNNAYMWGEKWKLADICYSSNESLEDRIQSSEKLKQVIDHAIEEYDISKALFTIQRTLYVIECSVAAIGNDEEESLAFMKTAMKKNVLQSWVSITEALYFSYKSVEYYMKSHLDSDKAMIELYIKNWYDPDRKYTWVESRDIQLPNIIVFDQEMENIKNWEPVSSQLEEVIL